MDYKSIIKTVVNQAKEKSGIHYIYTLLRMEGWTRFKKDPLLAFYEFLKLNKDGLDQKTPEEINNILNIILSEYETYNVISNLIGNAMGETYKFRPLPYVFIQTEHGPIPKSTDNIAHIQKLLEKVELYKKQNRKFYTIFKKVFGNSNTDGIDRVKDVQQKVNFLLSFFDLYFEELKLFHTSTKVHKTNTRQFMVFELLTNDNEGLFGINIHHSTGAISSFKRFNNKTENLNYGMSSNGEVELSIGNWADVKNYWVFNNSPLYLKGIRGRYNLVGEWKPLVYPSSASMLSAEAHKLCKDEKDKRIEGCIFYMMVTCFHVIEFIIKSNIELPYSYSTTQSSFGNIHFHKVDMQNDKSSSSSNLVIYDCTIELNEISVQGIKDALDFIDIFVNRLAFRVNGKAEWMLKYEIYSSSSGKKTISKRDFSVLGKYLVEFRGGDISKLDTSISWYNNGNSSKNIFTKFLSYYIALEGLAIPLVDGDLDVSLRYGIKKLPKKERDEKISKCILKMHESLYDINPIEFVNQSYFECIKSIKVKTENALKKVFGNQHEFVNSFFDKSGGLSIYQLRNKLAHGDFSHTDQEHAQAIQEKLPLLADITHRFIMNLSLNLKGKRKYKSFNKHSLTITTSDPRSTAIASSLDFIPNKDWKIRWDWLF